MIYCDIVWYDMMWYDIYIYVHISIGLARNWYQTAAGKLGAAQVESSISSWDFHKNHPASYGGTSIFLEDPISLWITIMVTMNIY